MQRQGYFILIISSSPGSVVTFKVTDSGETKIHIVHKEFACYYSPLLDAAFNGNSEIAKAQTFSIGDGTTFDAFDLLVQWFYRQNIQLKSLAKDFEKQSMSAVFYAALSADELKVMELRITCGQAPHTAPPEHGYGQTRRALRVLPIHFFCGLCLHEHVSR